jgi:SAM-dependent methyltransferase
MAWWMKLSAKLLLARLPIPYAWWREMGLFKHGQMDRVEYALKIFRYHTGQATEQTGVAGKTLLELGPGDSILSGLIAHAQGATQTYLVDVGDHATKDMAFYQKAAAALQTEGLPMPEPTAFINHKSLCQAIRTTYLTHGLEDLRRIPTASVDVVWSHSVLEHIRLHEFAALMVELKRILKPGAMASHNIDYQDHLAHALNNLRFPEWLWESAFFADSGFYTNRIPMPRMVVAMEQAGFRVIEKQAGYWDRLPTPRHKLAAPYRAMNDQELLARTGYVLLAA